MKRKTIRTISYFLIISVLIVCLSGCSLVPSVNLTEEQMELVSEYSAGLLMKYIKGHNNGLQNIAELDYAVLNLTPTPTPIVVEPVVIEEPIVESPESSGEISENGQEDNNSVEFSIVPMNEAFGLGDFDLGFDHIEICDTYPSSDTSLVLSMNAALGNNLMVLHFNLVNNSNVDMNCATNLNGAKVRALLNGTDKIRSEITLLPNDLINFSDVLGAGETRDVVIVYEVPESTNIDSLNLMLVNGGDVKNYQIL